MRIPTTKAKHASGQWERLISRYLTANGIPLTWHGQRGGFKGISGYTFRRIAPRGVNYTLLPQTWARMPEFWRENRDISNLIVIVTNRTYGSDLEDSLVVMRLGTFGPVFKALVDSNRERMVKDAT